MKRALSIFLLVLFAIGCGDAKKPATNPPSEPDSPKSDASKPDTISPDKPSPQKLDRIDTPSEPSLPKSQIDEWVAKLRDPSDETRAEAEQALLAAGGSAVGPLLASLKDPSVETRRAVAYFLLEKFPSGDDRIAAAMRDALADDDRNVRQLALQAVKRMPPETMVLAAAKIAGLLDSSREEPVNRADAARVLGRLGPDAREALTALVKAAGSDPSEKVRAPALYSVTKIAEPSASLPVLVASLTSDKDASVRLVAASGLARLGPAAASAAGELASAIDDRDEKVRRAASDALAGLDAAAVSPLVAKLDSPNPRTRELALFTLGRLGPTAKPAAKAINKLTKDEDAAVRALAEAVLASLGEL